MANEQKEKASLIHKILTVIGTIICIALIPVLIINCTLLFKGYTNKDEVPGIGGYFPLIVLTDSMYPEFSGGDLIISKTVDAEDVKVGDVIAFFDPAGNGTSIVTHRVIEITTEDGKLSFLTKGDANNVSDSVPATEDDLVGMYTGIHIPGAGNIAMFMQTTTGLIVCVVLPLLLLIGYDVIRKKLYDRKHQGDKDALMAELEELRKMKAEQEKKAE